MARSHKLTPAAEWLLAHVSYAGNDCLIWPFREHCDGYGAVRYEGRTQFAHRVMCELAHGKPAKGLVACHDCGNGGKGCVNPRHLAWKTQKENWGDRKRHGTPTNNGRGRLTYADRMKIHELRNKKTQAELAEMFGVARSTIGCIQRAKKPNKYRGVHQWGQRFASIITIDGQRHKLGVFDSREEAAAAYQAKAAEILGRPLR